MDSFTTVVAVNILRELEGIVVKFCTTGNNLQPDHREGSSHHKLLKNKFCMLPLLLNNGWARHGADQLPPTPVFVIPGKKEWAVSFRSELHVKNVSLICSVLFEELRCMGAAAHGHDDSAGVFSSLLGRAPLLCSYTCRSFFGARLRRDPMPWIIAFLLKLSPRRLSPPDLSLELHRVCNTEGKQSTAVQESVFCSVLLYMLNSEWNV